MRPKNRYSFPGRIIELLLTEDKFFQDLLKIKKVENTFPRYDQWKDNEGLHLSFALAGYAPEDVSISTSGRQLFVSADGLEDITEAEIIYAIKETDLDKVNLEKLESPAESPDWTINLKLDVDDKEVIQTKDLKPSLHKGFVSRGIARRSFKTNLYISEGFDIANIKANMANGLLHIFIPESSVVENKIVINKVNDEC